MRLGPMRFLLLAAGLPAAMACSPPLECGAAGFVAVGGVCVPVDAGTDASMISSDDAAVPASGCERGSCRDAGPVDLDRDGVEDDQDNCPEQPNADQADFDEDGKGDVCDGDTDGDGLDDAEDACPLGATGLDTDGDGCIDEGEDDDDDDDGVTDGEDNCPLVHNADQANLDGDGSGDACDGDRDDDGILNEEDACPLGASLGADSDRDGCKDDQEDDDDDDDGLKDDEDLCPTVAATEHDDIDGDGCPLDEDACPLGGAFGSDLDEDGCYDREDPSPSNPARPGPPAVVYVSADGPAGGDGTSWDSAFRFLQDGLDEVDSLQEQEPDRAIHVWVSVGSYYPDDGESMAADDRDASFTLREGVSLFGGFRRSEETWLRDSLQETVLSGDLTQNDLVVDGLAFESFSTETSLDNSCHVVRDDTAAHGAVLDGFTIAAGVATSDCDVPYGGGIASSGHAEFRNLHVVGNIGAIGSGAWAEGVSTWLYVDFRENRAINTGGGMAVLRSAATAPRPRVAAHGVRFIANTAQQLAGGLYVSDADASISHAVFRSNESSAGGGAIYCAACVLEAKHVSASGNAGNGAAVEASGESEVDFYNTLLWGNHFSVTSIEIGGAVPVVRYVSSSIAEGEPGENLIESPVESPFVLSPNLDFAPSRTGDLHLRTTSSNPARNAGELAGLDCPAALREITLVGLGPLCDADSRLRFDADEAPSSRGSAPDLGAYESQP